MLKIKHPVEIDLLPLLTDPSRVEDIPAEVIPILMVQCIALQSTLAARLFMATRIEDHNGMVEEGDRLLTVKEAAQKLGVSGDWLYRRANKLPFTVRLASRQLRFSLRGIERYIRQRQGR